MTTKYLFHTLSTVASENVTNYQCYGHGAVIYYANTTSILNASVSFVKKGILVFQSILTTIESSHVAYTKECGIKIYQSMLTTIKHTSVTHSQEFGIKFQNSTNNLLSHLFINESKCGLDVSVSSNLVVKSTKILKATKVGIKLLCTRNASITNTLVKGSSDIEEQTAEGNGTAKIWSNQNSISRAVLMGTKPCIFLDGASNTVIKWSNLTQCSIAIKNSTASTVVFTSIMRSSPQGTGISITDSTNSNISHVTIRPKYTSSPEGIGLFLMKVINTTFADSHIDYANTGVYLNEARFTAITGVSLNAVLGIVVSHSKNAFIENVTTISNTSGINAKYSNETVVTDVTIRGEASFPVDVDNCRNMSIENLKLLLPNSALTEITFIASNNILLHGVDILYPTSYTSLRLVIGGTTEVSISDVSIMHGGPIQLSQGGGMDISQSINIMISNVFFANMNNRQCTGDACYSQNHTVASTSILGQPAVVYLQNSRGITFKNCSFVNNSATALKVVDSSFTFSDIVKFTNNRATRGAAIILSQKSYMIIMDSTRVIFKDNYAALTGGAIHLDGYRDQINMHIEVSYILSNVTLFTVVEQRVRGLHDENFYRCFLKAGTSQQSLHFINNSAGQGGDVLYGGNLEMECITQNHDCTESCLTFLKNISDISPNGSLSKISSDPSRVCLCNAQVQPDCNIVSGHYSIYPGQSVSLSAVVVGQDFGTVQGSVFVQFIDQSSNGSTHQLGIGQTIQGASQLNCNKLRYTIFSSSYKETALVLSASHREKFYYAHSEEVLRARETYNQPGVRGDYWSQTYYYNILLEALVTLNFTFLPCPPGFELNSPTMKCDCNDLLQLTSDTTCNIEDMTIQHRGSVWIGPLVTTDDNHTDTIQDVVVAQYCPLDDCALTAVGESFSTRLAECAARLTSNHRLNLSDSRQGFVLNDMCLQQPF